MRKGTKLCYTYSPYSCLHVAVTSWSKSETIQRGKTNKTSKQTNKNKKVDGCFLPNGRHGALHFADDVKVFGRGRADDCVCFVRHLRLCVCRVLTEQRMNSVVSVRPRSCGQSAAREIFGKKKQKPQNKQNKTIFRTRWWTPLIPVRVAIPAMTTETQRERYVRGAAETSECVCTYVCLLAKSLCIYWVNVYIWYVYVYIQSVCICRVYSYFFPLMFLSLSMTRSSQVTNTEAWKGFYKLYRAITRHFLCRLKNISEVCHLTAAFLKLSHDTQNSHNLTLALILWPTLRKKTNKNKTKQKKKKSFSK